MKMTGVLAALTIATTTVLSGADNVETARFTVQSHDIAIELMHPRPVKLTTSKHSIITGCHVVVLISDRFEMTSAPQCHWDGINENSRYSYTLYYSLKGSTTGATYSYSLNLLDFTSIFADNQNVCAIPMGVLPQDCIVIFKPAKVVDIAQGADFRRYLTTSK